MENNAGATEQVAYLSVVGGEPVTADWGQVLIGTGPSCGLRLHDDRVGELHCVVVGRGGRFFLRNFDRSGTVVGGRLVYGELELRDGDWLHIGSQCVQVLFVPRTAVDLRPAALTAAPQTQIIPKAELPEAAPLPKPAPRRTRVTQIIARSVLTEESAPPPPAAPAIRKTRVTQIIAKPVLTEETEPAHSPAAPVIRKTRITQIIRKAALVEPPPEEVPAPLPPAPQPPPQEITEEAVANYLLAGDSPDSAPAIPAERSAAASAPPAAGALPAYALATDAAGRPALRIVVGRKDRAAPLLRKWEMEAAQAPPRSLRWRPSARGLPRGVGAAAIVALVALALLGGFHLGKPRQPRAFANPNPVVLTVDRWNELSDTEKLDYEILQQHLAGQRRPDAPAEVPNF